MLKRINLTGNPNLGVYISVNEDVAIVPFDFPTEMENLIKEVLDVEIINTSIAGTNLNGALLTGNSNGFIASPYINDRELKTLRDNGINVEVIPGKYTAVGNIIAVNDYGVVASSALEAKAVKVIEDTLDVPVELSSVAGLDLLGSISVVTNKGFLVHRDSKPEEVELLRDIFKVEGDIGTVCRGLPFVGALAIANSKGVMVAEKTTGPEMARIEEALGFLDFDD
ncbi:MAG: translation initiation factor IF-6 [archaeon]|nr:translation initiation factor IF-6 [archaeon]